MTAKRTAMLVIGEKRTYFGEFGYLNNSCIRKGIILMFLSSSRAKFTLLQQNPVTDVSVRLFVRGTTFLRISPVA